MNLTPRRTVRALVASSAVPLLAACGGGEAVSAGDAIVLVSERTGSGMEALGGGRLEVVGGCLGACGYVIVWPHGTEVVDDEPLTIDVPGHGTYASVTRWRSQGASSSNTHRRTWSLFPSTSRA